MFLVLIKRSGLYYTLVTLPSPVPYPPLPHPCFHRSQSSFMTLPPCPQLCTLDSTCQTLQRGLVASFQFCVSAKENEDFKSSFSYANSIFLFVICIPSLRQCKVSLDGCYFPNRAADGFKENTLSPDQSMHGSSTTSESACEYFQKLGTRISFSSI